MNFQELYQSYYEQIYKFCYRFVSDPDLAGDITQDTFVKMLNRMRQRNPDIKNHKAWLYKVASNLCLNTIQTNNRRKEIMGDAVRDITNENTPESEFIAKEKAMLAKRALDQLAPEHQILLYMYQDGLSYKEMSEATGIPVNSIGKTLWRNIEKVSVTYKTAAHG